MYMLRSFSFQALYLRELKNCMIFSPEIAFPIRVLKDNSGRSG
jgi:hypothetical protein